MEKERTLKNYPKLEVVMKRVCEERDINYELTKEIWQLVKKANDLNLPHQKIVEKMRNLIQEVHEGSK